MLETIAEFAFVWIMSCCFVFTVAAGIAIVGIHIWQAWAMGMSKWATDSFFDGKFFGDDNNLQKGGEKNNEKQEH